MIANSAAVSDVADEHTPRTFLGYYAHGTTLRVLSGRVAIDARRAWFERAVSGRC